MVVVIIKIAIVRVTDSYIIIKNIDNDNDDENNAQNKDNNKKKNYWKKKTSVHMNDNS